MRGLLHDYGVRFTFGDLSVTVSDGLRLQDTDPLAGYFFGRSLVVAGLLAPLLTGTERYSLRWEYEGKLSSLFVDVNAMGHIRGIPRVPHLAGTSDSEAGLYGDGGTIMVLKSDEGRILSSGSTKAGLLDVVQDISLHFSVSEQVETELVAVLEFQAQPDSPVRVAAGMMIQAMPGCDLEGFSRLRLALKSQELSDVLRRSHLDPRERFREAVEALGVVLPWDGREGASTALTLVYCPSPSYTCSCSRSRMRETVVTMLDKRELDEILEKQGAARIRCKFCSAEYSFGREELDLQEGQA